MFRARLGPPCIAISVLLDSVVGLPLSSRVAVRSSANIEFLQTSEVKTADSAASDFQDCPRDSLEQAGRVDTRQREKLQGLASAIRLGSEGLHLRIGCAFKTSHLARQRSLDAIQTWGRRCDAIYAFSDEEWTLPGNMGVTTIPIRQQNSDYAHLWQKTQMIFGNLSHVYWDRDNLDFLVIADDDTFFIMENLRTFLASDSIRARQVAGKPIIYGDLYDNPKHAPTMQAWVNGGGYVINRAAVDEVSKCTHRLAQENIIAEDVMVCSCLARSDWKVNLYQESNGCDNAGRKMFSQESILYTWGKDATSMSPDLVEFHHAVGEERYHFFRSLYSDDSVRLCAEISPSELRQLQNGIRSDRASRQLAWRDLYTTSHTGKWKEIPAESSLLSLFEDGTNMKNEEQPVPCTPAQP
jgi:hypothetical protein|eukprot:CAMPEP_0169083372 /NCGR_PEP_ID=MMETSP1015-20121227/12047_1 /TAXON_ID=342587 /ORGANISM="Karlodinium micrum, Strain CCMP2283" /LENGTH=410 /DNA_ID=CAMNT_0009143299 /DNA_START=49 /DNA_END=1281 /DNA_ORIENTATION=+